MRVSEDGVLDALDSVVHTSQGERRKCKFAQGLSCVASCQREAKKNTEFEKFVREKKSVSGAAQPLRRTNYDETNFFDEKDFFFAHDFPLIIKKKCATLCVSNNVELPFFSFGAVLCTQRTHIANAVPNRSAVGNPSILVRHNCGVLVKANHF